jgi:hypothetical protein
MSAPVEGAFGACLQFASEQARVWVPRWLAQLNAALQQQESAARSFVDKQACGTARTLLAEYQEWVVTCFLAELDELLRGAAAGAAPVVGTRKRMALGLEDLELVDHGQAQQKVDLVRVQQIVRMTAEEPMARLNALLSRARGFDVLRVDANPLHPDAIVSALTRALATLHLHDDVHGLWLLTGAVPLGEELRNFYDGMENLLVQRGVEPAGYLVVQSPESHQRPSLLPGTEGDPDRVESLPLAALPEQGSNPTLDHLHGLLAGHLNSNQGKTPSPSDTDEVLACHLATEIVKLMLHRLAQDDRLLQPLRDVVQELEPGLMKLARSDPRFFAERENPAQRLVDAITFQGSTFFHDQAPGFAEFAACTRRVVGALKLADSELPGLLLASLHRFSISAGSQAACGTALKAYPGSEEEPPGFSDTVPMDRFALMAERHPGMRHSGGTPNRS